MTYSLGMRPLKIRGKPLAVVALAALVTAMGGCGGSGGGPATVGPLSSGNSIHDPGQRASVCAPGGQPWAFGLDQFTNYGHITVVLDRVVLLHPRNEHLVGSYAVPGDRVVGVVHWPPRNPQTQPAWKDRKPVHGFRLAPGKSFNMVLGVAAIAGGRRATSLGMLSITTSLPVPTWPRTTTQASSRRIRAPAPSALPCGLTWDSHGAPSHVTPHRI